jgi:hypothetical protein
MKICDGLSGVEIPTPALPFEATVSKLRKTLEEIRATAADSTNNSPFILLKEDGLECPGPGCPPEEPLVDISLLFLFNRSSPSVEAQHTLTSLQPAKPIPLWTVPTTINAPPSSARDQSCHIQEYESCFQSICDVIHELKTAVHHQAISFDAVLSNLCCHSEGLSQELSAFNASEKEKVTFFEDVLDNSAGRHPFTFSASA